MTSKHFRWQLAWRVDIPGRTCTHELGLVFQWHDKRIPAAACPAIALDGAEWFAEIQGGPEAVRAWLAAQPSIRDQRSKATRLQRACREASEAWSSAMAGKWRTPHTPRVVEILAESKAGTTLA